MDIKMWIQEIIEQKQRVAIPIMTHPGIEKNGNSVKEALQDGAIHAKAIEKINDVYPVAATTAIMDLTLEAEAFGCQIDFPEHEMPNIIGRLVSSAEEIEKLKVPDLSAGRIAEFLMANQLTVNANYGKPVLAGAIGPFSLAGRLYDMSEIMMACYMEPDVIMMLLEKCTQFLLSYCTELKRIGCSGVVIAEPAAGLLSNDDGMIYSTPYIKQIVDALQDDHFLVVLHNCGNHGHCTGAMLASGAGALHFGNAMNMVEALTACPEDMLIMGNIDPVGVLKNLTSTEVFDITTSLLRQTAAFENFVLSTGCDLPPQVSARNIRAFFDALNAYNMTNCL